MPGSHITCVDSEIGPSCFDFLIIESCNFKSVHGTSTGQLGWGGGGCYCIADIPEVLHDISLLVHGADSTAAVQGRNMAMAVDVEVCLEPEVIINFYNMKI